MDCWHQELERARSEADVVKRAGDYLFLWAPQELAPVTLGWRELRIETASDIERIKQWLVESVSSTQPLAPRAAALRELASYFWHAAIRIQEIRGSRMRVSALGEYPAVALHH